MPDFLIVGAQKSGTSTLYSYLVEEPAVYAALRKEVHFFDHNFHKGVGWYRSFFPLTRSVTGGFTGEASPFYLYHPKAVERAATVVPDVRVIVLLRDPIARAYSHYKHSRATGVEPVDVFEDALAREEERIAAGRMRLSEGAERERSVESFSYVDRGLYGTQLSRWLNVFPRDAIKVFFADQLFSSPETTGVEALEFIGVRETGISRDLIARNVRGSYPAMGKDTFRRLADVFIDDATEVERLTGQTPPWTARWAKQSS